MVFLFFPPSRMLGAASVAVAAALLPQQLSACPQLQNPTIYVDFYGATPNDDSDDDSAAIQEAIDVAIRTISQTNQAVSVAFTANATYHIGSTLNITNHNPWGSHLASNALLLKGNNAEIVLVEPNAHIFRVHNSTYVTVKDLTLDVDPLPYTDGVVTAVGGGRVTIEVERGNRDPLYFASGQHWGWLLDASVPGRPMRDSDSVFTATGFTSPAVGFLRFAVSDPGDFAVGDRLTYLRRAGENFWFTQSPLCTVQNVTSYGAGGMFLNASNSGGLTVDSCDVCIKASRWHSTNGDGVHAEGCDYMIVDSCLFEGLSDDAIHVKDTHTFDITYNVFTNKRRHALLLDGDGAAKSTNGTIDNNVATYCGGAFFHHHGGAYSSFTFTNNSSSMNNRTQGPSTIRARLESAAHAGNFLATGSIPMQGDTVILTASSLPVPQEMEWNIVTNPASTTGYESLLCNNAAQVANSWLYLEDQNPLTKLEVGALNGVTPIVAQQWTITEVVVGGTTYYTIEATPGQYLTATSSTTVQLAAQSTPLPTSALWIVTRLNT